MLSMLLLIVLLQACSGSSAVVNSNNPAIDTVRSISGVPNYSNLYYWAAHPWKKDLSDSIPISLQKNYVKDSLADVFFIHPTTLTNASDQNWNANVDDAITNAKTDYGSILYQASVFNEKTRVFAPRYRQAHLRAFSTLNRTKADSAFDIAYSDIKNAFELYLKNYNKGRPIIIASHSQGTLHAARLLKEFFDGKPLQSKLVCAYIIGLPVKQNEFKNIAACNTPGKTGCVVSWRTYERGYEGEAYIARESFKSININPLTFMQDTLYAAANLNKGGILRDFSDLTPALVDAQVHNNILWVSKPKVLGSNLITMKNYHIADYNLFYANIANDVKNRIALYLKK